MVSSKIYDVIVIGAGLSGLQAAVTVQKNGLSCLILEARDRIGGKVLSVPVTPDTKVTVDAGAAWINDTSQSHMFALAQKYGAEFQEQTNEGDVIAELPTGDTVRMPRGSLPGSPEQQARLLELVGVIDALGQQIKQEKFAGPLSRNLDKITFDVWVQEQTQGFELASFLAKFLTRALVGAEAQDVSALYMLKYIEAGTGFMNIAGSGKNGGQYLRPKQGSQLYVNGLASELKPDSIQTSSPVTSLTQNDNDISLTTSNGAIHHCQKAIISIPTPLYKHISFTPPLPPTKQTLSTTTKLGYYTKVVASYNHPWWRTTNLAGELQSFSSNTPISMVLDTSIPSQSQYSLSLFMLGAPGAVWSEQPDRVEFALKELTRLFSPYLDGSTIPEPIATLCVDWAHERWIEGAPSSVYPVGVLATAAGEALREPVGDVHFVGTEMSDVWEGYMEGAVREGERGGLEVVHALKRSL